MRLVEKKCPNCGAGIEFEENAKSCKCDYCKRSFVIERESNNKDFYDPRNYILQQQKFGSVLAIIITFTAIFIFGVVMITSMHFNSDVFNSTKSNPTIYSNVSELNTSDLEDVDRKSYWVIEKKKDGLTDYYLDMSVKRENIYIAYNKKDDSNLLIGIYKAKYSELGFSGSEYQIYVPVIYKNIAMKDAGITFQLDNGSVEAPEYYFNLEHSEYAYGYQDMETVEKEVIEPLKSKGYSISKK